MCTHGEDSCCGQRGFLAAKNVEIVKLRWLGQRENVQERSKIKERKANCCSCRWTGCGKFPV